MKRYLSEDVIKEIVGDHHVSAELEREWDVLNSDRVAIRETYATGTMSNVGVCSDYL